jgi:hypothetical protein
MEKSILITSWHVLPNSYISLLIIQSGNCLVLARSLWPNRFKILFLISFWLFLITQKLNNITSNPAAPGRQKLAADFFLFHSLSFGISSAI